MIYNIKKNKETFPQRLLQIKNKLSPSINCNLAVYLKQRIVARVSVIRPQYFRVRSSPVTCSLGFDDVDYEYLQRSSVTGGTGNAACTPLWNAVAISKATDSSFDRLNLSAELKQRNFGWVLFTYETMLLDLFRLKKTLYKKEYY